MTIDFWKLKHQIDDEVARLGWTKAKCKAYIQSHYGKDSRLKMTDDQLVHLLDLLRGLAKRQTTSKKLRLRLGKNRGRRSN